MTFTQRADPFVSTEGRPMVSVPSGRGIQTYPLDSLATRNFIAGEAFAATDEAPTSQTIGGAVRHLHAQAERQPQIPVAFRVAAPAPDRLALDLSNSQGEYVEITPTGFETTAGSRIRFEASPAFLTISAPVTPTGDALESLRTALNIPAPDWLRVLAWLLTSLHPAGPFPILILRGPSGCGKSFAARILRALIDPVHAPLSAPTSARDLLKLARLQWVLALDHVTSLTPKLADALCRLSTGVEDHGRWIKRPVILTAPDTWEIPDQILEHAFCVTLPPLTARRPEPPMLQEFVDLSPQILGCLCAALSRTLANPPDPKAAWPTRFPHTAALVHAAFPDLAFLDALNAPPPPTPFVAELQAFLQTHPDWTGTATDLLDELPQLAASPRALSARLRAARGLTVNFRRTHNGARLLSFLRYPDSSSDHARRRSKSSLAGDHCVRAPLVCPDGVAPVQPRPPAPPLRHLHDGSRDLPRGQ